MSLDVYPLNPAEVLGKLKMKNIFYKNSLPNLYGWGGSTHKEWVYLIAILGRNYSNKWIKEISIYLLNMRKIMGDNE